MPDNTLVTVSIGERRIGYVVMSTDAPDSYDGFGTVTLEGAGRDRVVLIETENLSWQMTRYLSGMHSCENIPGLQATDIEATLWERMKRP